MKDERFYLGHIRDAIRDIEEYSVVGRDQFMTDRMRQDGLLIGTIAAALAMLGPGRWSVDAQLFG